MSEISSSGGISYEGYVLDAENAAEMARLMVQDHVLTRAMGGALSEQSDLSHVHRVLDIACGPGGWLFDLVKQYPHVQGVGVDISQLMMEYAASLATSQGLPNVEFHVMDVTQELKFPDNTFDMINGRILTGFLFNHQWPALLRECARITKPGGILRLAEAEWGFTNSVALDTLSEYTATAFYRSGHSFSPRGRTIGTANVLRLLMQQAGYEQIEQRAHVVDFSAGTEAHDSNIQNDLVIYKMIQPFFLKMQVATVEELERLYGQLEEDVQKDDFSAVDYFLTVWGQKS
jgi:ubiquinone/menaquinone biosynthesis C-methylase UbiE